MEIKFVDMSDDAKAALERAVIAYLYEAAGELEAQTKRNSRPNKYQGRPAQSLWEYAVDESDKTAAVGSPYEAAFWEEFGTGEYALNKDGRKGWWVYVEGNDSPRGHQNYYTEQEAKQTAAYLRSKDLDAHATNGIEPNRPLHTAFTTKKAALIRRAEEVLRGELGK